MYCFVIITLLRDSQVNQEQRTSMAYIDYQKPFDSLPHCWLRHALELYGIENHIKLLLHHAVSKWNTRLKMNTPPGNRAHCHREEDFPGGLIESTLVLR